ncbi:hypothetical protein Tco_1379735 [Tanacetum coccineum]
MKKSKDLSLSLDELIGNLKVHEMIMEKDSELVRGKQGKIKSLALKAKKESSDDETSTSRSKDEEYAMVVRELKNFFRRRGSALDAEIQTTLSENVRNRLRTTTKRRLSEVLRAIAMRKMKKRQTKKLVLCPKHQMRLERNKVSNNECESCHELRIENENLKNMQTKLLVEASKFTKFEKSIFYLKDMLGIHKPAGDKRV